jgi:hypothetical protein
VSSFDATAIVRHVVLVVVVVVVFYFLIVGFFTWAVMDLQKRLVRRLAKATPEEREKELERVMWGLSYRD